MKEERNARKKSPRKRVKEDRPKVTANKESPSHSCSRPRGCKDDKTTRRKNSPVHLSNISHPDQTRSINAMSHHFVRWPGTSLRSPRRTPQLPFFLFFLFFLFLFLFHFLPFSPCLPFTSAQKGGGVITTKVGKERIPRHLAWVPCQ